jgi:hypothetical protein
MENLPTYISILFIITTIITVIWFYMTSKSKLFLGIAAIWAALQTYLADSGFFQNFDSIPPRIFFAFAPTLVLMGIMFSTKKGKEFIQNINLETITYMSVIRIPVEIVLALLAHQGVISIWQTFEGGNFDILSGISAPIVAYMVFSQKKWGNKILLGWNIICLLLLITIIMISIFSLPSPLQQISFDQPNLAMTYFPFILLPGLVVPIVFFSHLVAIKRLWK